MPSHRKRKTSLKATPFYHCVSLCARRAFICANNNATGRCYEHRCKQLEEKALWSASIIFIDIAAFTILSNHYHLVLHVNQTQSQTASPRINIERLLQLFSDTEATTKFLNNETVEPLERDQLNIPGDLWRERLYSISWFMRVLNEPTVQAAKYPIN